MTQQSSTTRIRLGLIGTGLATEKLHWPALRRLTDRFEVVAFANHTRPKAEHFAQYSGASMDGYVEDYADLLRRADVDAVLISLPIPLNLPVTRAALEAGKHVICEKPAGRDLEEGRAYVELVREHPDRVVLVAENWFYRDDLRLARKLLDDGAIGRMHLAAWRNVSQLIPREGQFSVTPWRHDPDYVGGPHLDAGVHHMAQLRLLCGDVERVSGELQDANSTHGGPSDLALSLRFVSGAIGSYLGGYPELPLPPDDSALRLYGTDALMTIGREGTSIYRPDGTRETHRVERADGGYFNEFVDFHDALTRGASLVGTAEQTLRNMEVVLQGLQAARNGAVETIADGWPTTLAAGAVPLWRPAESDDIFAGLGVKVTVETTQVG